jgi:hypothetical protein
MTHNVNLINQRINKTIIMIRSIIIVDTINHHEIRSIIIDKILLVKYANQIIFNELVY